MSEADIRFAIPAWNMPWRTVDLRPPLLLACTVGVIESRHAHKQAAPNPGRPTLRQVAMPLPGV